MTSSPTATAANYGYTLDPAFKGLLSLVGVQGVDVLRRAGLPEDLFSQPDIRLSTDEYFAFAQAIQDSVDDPLFPLRFVEWSGAEWFSPLVFASLCSPDLTTAVTRLARFKALLAPVKLIVASDSAGLRVRYQWLESPMGSPLFLTGSEALFLVKLARMGTRYPVNATSVTLRELPREREAFEAFLGCRIRRGEELSVSFSPDDATRPFLTDNRSMWEIFEPQLRKQLSDLEGASSFEARTRALLLEALPRDEVSIERVARQLAVSSRTLQRRLREEGTNFKALIRRTREGLARHYLSRTRLSYAEIAYLLGFHEVSSFFRAFRDWTGTTPTSFRESPLPGL